ncbi:hypothetical protein Hanom_Chr10g00938211 [Helianthus anomalus]
MKKGDTFSDWQVCRDWLHGTFLPTEVKFQEERSHDQSYHAYLEEDASFTSTTHRIVREWRSMHREWAAFEASKKEVSEEKARVALLRAKLEANQAEFANEQKTEEWSVAGWKRKAKVEVALPLEERKRWKEICEKNNNEKMGPHNVINNLKAEIEKLKKQDAEIEKLKKKKAGAEAARDEARSHRERSERRELERVEKAETSRRLSETEEKLENSETARVTAESLVEPLKDDMLLIKHHGIISVANPVLNSNELDQSECTHHVTNALRVDWDTSRSATHGVDTEAAHAAAKTEYNNLRLPVMDLVTDALQADDFVA